MLKEYPKHIERLQLALNRSAEESLEAPLMPFDDAISTLEGVLEAFMIEARTELADAMASEDSKAIERATEKERLMSFARSSNIGMANLSELRAYFDTNMD